MLKMNIGELTSRISFLQESQSQDPFGAPTSQWTEVYKCWASIDVQQSQLLYSTAEFVSKATYRITFRYNRGPVIDASMRIRYVSAGKAVIRIFTIESLIDVQQAHEWVVCLCYELDGVE